MGFRSENKECFFMFFQEIGRNFSYFDVKRK